MASTPVPGRAFARGNDRSRGSGRFGAYGLRAAVVSWLGLLVVLPIAVVAWKSTGGGAGEFWKTITDEQAVAALRLTVVLSAIVVAINVVTGVLLAWVLVRDDFRGRHLVDGLIDLPFALPTIVSGLILLTLYGPQSPLGIDVAYTRIAIVMALLFITLPFVVRSVQPVLAELDAEQEEAATSLGASDWTTFRRIILPSLLPAVLAGGGLAFARALGEFGSIVLLAGNIPFKTEVASLYIFGLVEQDDPAGASAISIVLVVMAIIVQTAATLLRRRFSRGF